MKAFDWSRFLKGDPGRAYRLLTLILVGGAILWTAWNLMNKLGTPFPMESLRPSAKPSVPARVAAQAPVPAQPLAAYLSIKEKNPFGIVPQAGDPAGENPKEEAPPPPPPVELQGTISFGNAKGFAILKDPGQERKKVYKVGDSLSGGRILVQVGRSMVVLKKGEIRETLHTRTLPVQSSALPQGEEASRQKLVARNELMSRLSNVIDQSLIRPHFSNGKMDGFIVGRVTDDSPLKAAGFETGDLLQGINGKVIQDPDDVFLLQSLKKGSGRVTYQIQRQGRSMVLNAS